MSRKISPWTSCIIAALVGALGSPLGLGASLAATATVLVVLTPFVSWDAPVTRGTERRAR